MNESVTAAATERKIIARIDDVSIKYGQKTVFQNLSLDIAENAITCVIGLSGAGKTTVLRLLNGLQRPNSGHVYMRGIDVCHTPERELNQIRQSIGFAFQFAALFDSLTIAENVALPLVENTKMSREEIDRAVSNTLESVGLGNVEQRMPAELSGGMLKRAGFARAIVTNPALVLYDEPTTGLDPIVTHLLTDMIKQLRAKMDGTAVVISHDLNSIYMMADYVAMLFEGAIIFYGTVDELKSSINPIVQQFLQGSEVGPIPI